MNENVRQKEGKAFRPWCEDEFISKVELPGIRQDQDWVGDPNAGSGISGRRESAQAQYSNGLQGIRPKKGAWLVEVRPDEELPPAPHSRSYCVGRSIGCRPRLRISLGAALRFRASPALRIRGFRLCTAWAAAAAEAAWAAANEMLTQMVEEQRISSSLEVHNE